MIEKLSKLVFRLLLLGAAGSLWAAERPNILFVFSDDHAAQAIGAYGSVMNQTPNIDRLAREGMLFRNAFVTNSICGPSRAVILTGRHSHQNGFYANEWGGEFDGSQLTFPKLLQQAGYQTALIGKWHLYSEPTGFDHWEVLPGQGAYYNPKFISSQGSKQYTGYVTDIITDLTLDWLQHQRDPDRPFLLMYQHKAPHREWSPGPDHLTSYDDRDIPEPATLFDDHSGRAGSLPEVEMSIADDLTGMDLKLSTPWSLNDAQKVPWEAAYGPKNKAFEEAGLEGKALVRWKYQRYAKDYLRSVASIDDKLGEVLDYLDESGLADNTIVVYSSDQGFFIGEHGWYDKRWMYEESLRIPLLVRWPGEVAPGSENRELVQNLDFAQTLLEAAGVAAPEAMQGRSLVPLLRDEQATEWRDAVYYHFYENPGWAFVPRHYGVRTQRYKLIHYYRVGLWELFDLDADPDELDNLYGVADYAALTAELKQRLEGLRHQYGVPETDPEPGWWEYFKFRLVHFLYSLS